MIYELPDRQYPVDGSVFSDVGEFKLKKCVVGMLAVIILFGTAHAAEKCNAGRFLDDTGECTPCGDRYYCPGDNVRYDCPDGSTRLRTTYPDNYNDIVRVKYYGFGYSYAATDITQCVMEVGLEAERGHLYEYVAYNPGTDKYDNTISYGWSIVNSGYYLSRPAACGTYAYYQDAVKCSAGGYCPGKDRVICNQGNKAEVHTETFGMNVCPDNTYSNAGASVCSPCPAGTGNRGDTLTAHAGVSSCRPLCGAGATKLHAGSYSFNIWSGGSCTSPAINVGLSGGTCCVNLESGAASGLNIKYNGNTYHAVN